MIEKYHINWSKTSIAITIVVFAIVIAVIVGLMFEGISIKSIQFLIIGLLVICLLYFGSYTPVRFELSDKSLIIHRIWGYTCIPINKIISCHRFYPTFLTKVCGSGGFCGSLGWYRTRDTGNFFSYVTDWKEAVLINLGTRKYMVSCAESDKLVSNIEELTSHWRNVWLNKLPCNNRISSYHKYMSTA